MKSDVLEYIDTVGNSRHEPRDTFVPFKGLMKSMFQSMTSSNSVPRLMLGDEVCVTEIQRLRRRMTSLLDLPQSLTMMPFFLKAASLSLHDFTLLNASVDENRGGLVFHSQHNICVAISTPRGLVAPCIRGVEGKSIPELAQELWRLTTDARQGMLREEDLANGTFTISNIGSIGGTYVVPVVVPPQVAIGAVGKIQRLPRYTVEGDVPLPTEIVSVSWAADHRVIDGATMAKFSNRWKTLIEEPDLMLAFMR
mmetsp:Transcript_11336/g.22942  ORF Transcript_11336/g.22942 Transcript_11336/m.22942 type:complete len:253 (+) Transcript_11336:1043-1801(+)